MAIKAHLDTLSRRHQELEAAIAAETKHPGFNEMRIVELKRQKLKLKDQLEEFRAQTNMPN